MIAVDDESTWPPSSVRLLRERSAELDAEDAEVAAFIRQYGGRTTGYPSKPVYRATARELDEMFAKHWLLGYHCTRLTDGEIAMIRSNGMRVLSEDHVHTKVNLAYEQELLDAVLHGVLKSNHCGTEDGRAGMLWMVFSRLTLRDEGGLARLFGYWGGEALYVPQTTDVRQRLRGVGRPAIVVMEVAVSALNRPIGECMMRYFRRTCDEGAGFEGYVCRDVPPDRVRTIMTDACDEFENLTGRSTWEKLDGDL